MGHKITAQDAAAEIGVSLRQVRRLISSGDLPAYRVGKTRMIRIDRDHLAGLFTPVVPAR